MSFFRSSIMKKLTLLLLIISCIAGKASLAQDTLPQFSLRNVGKNRIVIEWVNKFENVKQISIQRSIDSLKNFKTILTVSDPSLPANGFMDTKAPFGQVFYRLYIMMDKGMFLFSNTKRPVMDTMQRVSVTMAPDSIFMPRGNNINGVISMDNTNLIQPINVDGSAVGPNVSVTNKPKAEVWVPSKHVYTQKDGLVRITLPDDSDKKYHIKFFTLRDEFLFELKDLKEKTFTINKANFYQSGWFKFELYENDELKEKNRFYLPREF
jgi:hypothetical protein